MRRLVFFIGCLFVAACSHAEDLGTFNVQGGTRIYAPDKDAAAVLRERAIQKSKTSEGQQALKALQEKNVQALINPAPLSIPTESTRSSKSYAMEFVMPVDTAYARKGQKVNVLKSAGKLSDTASRIVFIDGRDQTQVDYAVRLSQTTPTKIILTGGSPIRIGERYAKMNGGNGIPFYYDQRGMFIRSLYNWYGIRLASVPAVLSDAGNGNLRIDYGF